MRTLAERYLPALASLLLVGLAAMALRAANGSAVTSLASLVFAAGAAAGLWIQYRGLRRADGEIRDGRQQAARLEALVRALPDAWCGWGPSGTQTLSPNFCALLGIARCERLEHVENALAPSDPNWSGRLEPKRCVAITENT